MAREFNLLNWCNGRRSCAVTRADTSLEDYPILLREIVRSGPRDRGTQIEKQAESEAICQGEVKGSVQVACMPRERDQPRK